MSILKFHEEVVRKRIEFFASSLDAFLQDFIEKAKADDKLGTIVACARLAQLGEAIGREYEANCNELCDSKTEQTVAQQQCKYVIDMVNENGRKCNIAGGAIPDEVPSPDRSLS